MKLKTGYAALDSARVSGTRDPADMSSLMRRSIHRRLRRIVSPRSRATSHATNDGPVSRYRKRFLLKYASKIT